MLRIIAIVIVLLAGALLAFAATRPDTFRFERSIVIEAAPSEVFPLVSDFREWRAWSPWEELDPELKRSYSGAERGKGAVYGWEGNDNVGAGRMEITEAVPGAHLAIDLHFIRPLESHQFAEFRFTAEGNATRVTWAMHGQTPFIWKLLSPFFDFDRIIGSMLETGLATLKTVAEGSGAQAEAEPRTQMNKGSI